MEQCHLHKQKEGELSAGAVMCCADGYKIDKCNTMLNINHQKNKVKYKCDRQSRLPLVKLTLNVCLCVCVQFAQGRYNSSGLDLNVMPVWKNNITGKGVVVSIIDDGESKLQFICSWSHTYVETIKQIHITK